MHTILHSLPIISVNRFAGIIMRKRLSFLKLSAIIFAIMFMINLAVMHIIFDINIVSLSQIQGLLSSLKVREQAKLSDPLDMVTLSESPLASSDMVTLGQSSAAMDDKQSLQQSSTESGEGQGREGVGSARVGVGDEGHKNEEADASSYYAVLPEEISFIHQLSSTDKLKAMAILSKMGRDEVNRIVDISRDGITYSELDELIESAQACLEPSDIETLKGLLPFVSLFPESHTP